MNKLKYFLIFIVVIVVLFFATIFATKDLHDRYITSAIERIKAGSSDTTIVEHEVESSLFDSTKMYTVSMFNGAASFYMIVQSSYLPFFEENQVALKDFKGSFFTCSNCDFKGMVATGYWTVNYLSNTYDGELQMQNYDTGSKSDFLKISGLSSNIYGSFKDKILHVGAKLDLIESGNAELKTHATIKRLVGDVDVEFKDGATLITTRNGDGGQSYVSMGQYYFNNVNTGVKVEAENVNMSIESVVNNNDATKVDINQYLQAKSFKYNNPDLNNDLDITRSDINIAVKNATQHYWVEFAQILHNFVALGKKTAKSFDYEVMKDLQKNNTRINIDRLQFVSDVSKGVLKIKKGSYIGFATTNSDTVKNGLDVSLDFSVDTNFIQDFPAGNELMQMFLSRDWLLHGALDSKDEYSTKLTIRKGRCSLGENMLPQC